MFIIVQVPFLEADPDVYLTDYSRDAYSDEGLNTSQVANYINTGEWGIDECDNLIKSPVFNAWLLPAYWIGGVSILSGRVGILLSILIVSVFVFKKFKGQRTTFAVALLIVISNYYLFQYSRFTMAESLISMTFMLFIFSIEKFKSESIGWRQVLIVSTIFWLCIGGKIQFAYLIVPFAVGVLSLCFKPFNLKLLMRFISVNAVFLVIYILLWYLPNDTVFIHVMEHQTGGRFLSGEGMWKTAYDQAVEFLFSTRNISLTLLSVIGIGIILIKLIFKKGVSLLDWIALSWLAIEMHKFFIAYVPPRYLVSTLFAMALFGGIQLVWLLKRSKSLGWSLVGVFVVIGVYNVSTQLSRRTYQAKVINQSLIEKGIGQGDVVAGPWAPILAKNTRAKVIPVWLDYFNDENLISEFNPSLIITELDESDSGGAYKERGLDLTQWARNCDTVSYANRKLLFYYKD